MNINDQVAKHFSDVFSGGNWTSVNLENTLKDISWQDATTKIFQLNTIAALVFHINYYVSEVLKVLRGADLTASDKYSFDVPVINSALEWQQLVVQIIQNAEMFTKEIEQFEEDKMMKDFADPKYGNYYRNIAGIIEHTHYHLGQIVVIKKIINQMKNAAA